MFDLWSMLRRRGCFVGERSASLNGLTEACLLFSYCDQEMGYSQNETPHFLTYEMIEIRATDREEDHKNLMAVDEIYVSISFTVLYI